MKTVRTYEIPEQTRFVVGLTAGAEVLCVQTQHDKPHLWVRMSTGHPTESRRFIVAGTGRELPPDAGRYVGTFQLAGRDLVYHVFEVAD